LQLAVEKARLIANTVWLVCVTFTADAASGSNCWVLSLA
jgi:hypothetical protein